MASMINWLTCGCCGCSAEQRDLSTHQGRFLPDICDSCWNSIVHHVVYSGVNGARDIDNAIWVEYCRRRDAFNKKYEVVGFKPIIRLKK